MDKNIPPAAVLLLDFIGYMPSRFRYGTPDRYRGGRRSRILPPS